MEGAGSADWLQNRKAQVGSTLSSFLSTKPLQGLLPAPTQAQHSSFSGQIHKLSRCEECILQILLQAHSWRTIMIINNSHCHVVSTHSVLGPTLDMLQAFSIRYHSPLQVGFTYVNSHKRGTKAPWSQGTVFLCAFRNFQTPPSPRSIHLYMSHTSLFSQHDGTHGVLRGSTCGCPHMRGRRHTAGSEMWVFYLWLSYIPALERALQAFSPFSLGRVCSSWPHGNYLMDWN